MTKDEQNLFDLLQRRYVIDFIQEIKRIGITQERALKTAVRVARSTFPNVSIERCGEIVKEALSPRFQEIYEGE